MTGFIKAGHGVINPWFVASMSWDRRHYANGPGDSALIVHMQDGREIRIRHEPHLWGGVDCYALEKAITDALASPPPPVAHETTPSMTDAALVHHAMLNARPAKSRGRASVARWVAVMDTFAVGSTYAHGLCQRFGLDPDEKVSR